MQFEETEDQNVIRLSSCHNQLMVDLAQESVF